MANHALTIRGGTDQLPANVNGSKKVGVYCDLSVQMSGTSCELSDRFYLWNFLEVLDGEFRRDSSGQ